MSSRAKKPGSQSRAKWQAMSEELSEELGLAAKRLRANGEARGDLQSAAREGLHGSRWWHGIARVERIRSGASQLEEGTQSPGLEYFAYVHCMLLVCMFVLFALGPHRHVPRWRRR